MNMGKLITQLKRALSVPAGSSYVVAMGDGTGTKQVFHEDVVESVKRDLPLGNMEELGTENKTDIVGAVNEIVEKLSIVGISYKGGYNPEAEYNFLDAVFYENSTFIAMKNNPEGLPAADGINWQYLAKGFMDGYLIAKSQIVNNLLATEPGNVLDAMQGKALADMLGEINSNLSQVMRKYKLLKSSAASETVNVGFMDYRMLYLCIIDSINSIVLASDTINPSLLTALGKSSVGVYISYHESTSVKATLTVLAKTDASLQCTLKHGDFYVDGRLFYYIYGLK